MNQNLAGRVAIVTGAASGIGLTVAHHLASRGATIVGIDRGEGVTELAATLPNVGHLGIVVDLTNTTAATEAVEEAVRRVGIPSILVNSAGVALLDSALDVTPERWEATLAINLSGSFFMAQAAGRHMVDAHYGRIINLASQAAVIGLDQHVAYSASKAGLLGMTRVLSREWARRGVTVNCVSPTVVETPLGKAAWAGERGEKAKEAIPVGRFAQPEEVAHLIGYLASEEAAMVTGENILIDGGFSSV
jgi:2-deoxy-D-gluconate 3-dehydrogenase